MPCGSSYIYNNLLFLFTFLKPQYRGHICGQRDAKESRWSSIASTSVSSVAEMARERSKLVACLGAGCSGAALSWEQADWTFWCFFEVATETLRQKAQKVKLGSEIRQQKPEDLKEQHAACCKWGEKKHAVDKKHIKAPAVTAGGRGWLQQLNAR